MNYKGNLAPKFQTASNGKGVNTGLDFMQIMGAKAAMDLNLDMSVKNKN